MNTNHDNHDKPLTGFEPAHRVFAELDLYHLATEAQVRGKIKQKPLTHHETNTALNEQFLLGITERNRCA